MSLIDGDDGLPANQVGKWAKEKHDYLRDYVGISRATRKKYIGPGKAGAAYVDLFCATGRANIRNTNEWIDGSAVAAWKASVAGGARFSSVMISDTDEASRSACAERLKRLGVPVVEIAGDALTAAQTVVRKVKSSGLHFAFIDPYSLGTLNFDILRSLSALKRIDMMIHVSVMDLQRNVHANPKIVDAFAPGWREHVDMASSRHNIRAQIVAYWREMVSKLGTIPAPEMKLITGDKGQRLYWLLVASHHPLARSFWGKTLGAEGQGTLL